MRTLMWPQSLLSHSLSALTRAGSPQCPDKRAKRRWYLKTSSSVIVLDSLLRDLSVKVGLCCGFVNSTREDATQILTGFISRTRVNITIHLHGGILDNYQRWHTVREGDSGGKVFTTQTGGSYILPYRTYIKPDMVMCICKGKNRKTEWK